MHSSERSCGGRRNLFLGAELWHSRVMNGIFVVAGALHLFSVTVQAQVEGQDWDSVGRANPRGRVGTPEDIAGLAIFLSSRAGAYTVGETITCDGGSVASS